MDESVSYVIKDLNKLQMRKIFRIQLLVPPTKMAKMLTEIHIQLFSSTKYNKSCRFM